MIALLMKSSHKVLIMGFSTIAMTFFMFSYHVHEKSILVPLALIPFVSQYIGGKIVIDLVVGGCVGMYHLLVEDGQVLGYYVMVLLYVVIGSSYYHAEEKFLSVYSKHKFEQPELVFTDRTASVTHRLHNSLYNNQKYMRMALHLCFIGLHLGKLVIPPP